MFRMEEASYVERLSSLKEETINLNFRLQPRVYLLGGGALAGIIFKSSVSIQFLGLTLTPVFSLVICSMMSFCL